MKVGENVGLDKDCKDFRWEVVANFEEWDKDCVGSPNNRGYVCFPAQGLVEENAKYFNMFCWPNIYIIHFEGKTRCPFNRILSTEKGEAGFICIHF